MTRHSLALAALLLLSVAGVLSGRPSAARAGCGGVVAARAGHGSIGRAPLEIGDSTSIYAVPILGRLGVEGDARGCRQFAEGLRVLQARRAAGSLPAVVILALGANGPIGRDEMTRALAILGPRRILLLVTARKSESRNAVMRATAKAHPDRVVLVDWVAASAAHPDWFAGDGLHVGQVGARAFARLIRRATARFAFPPVGRLHVPRHRLGLQDCGTAGPGRTVYVVRGSVTCGRARELARRPVTTAAAGWTAFDWRRTHVGPWSWVIERDDHRVLVAVVG